MFQFGKKPFLKIISALMAMLLLVCFSACMGGGGSGESTIILSKPETESNESQVESQHEGESRDNSDLEAESEVESSERTEDDESDRNQESEEEPEDDSSWAEGLAEKNDFSANFNAYIPDSYSYLSTDLWHATMLVYAVKDKIDWTTMKGTFIEGTLLTLNAQNNEFCSLVLDKPVYDVWFLENGYVCYYYIENADFNIVILNHSLEDDSAYLLENVDMTDKNIAGLWFDSPDYALYFQLSDGSRYRVNLMDGSCTELLFDRDIEEIYDGKIYYEEYGYLIAYDVDSQTSSSVGVQYFSNYAFSPHGYDFCTDTGNAFLGNEKIFASSTWGSLGTWNFFVSDNPDAWFATATERVMFLDSPIYQDFNVTSRSLIAVDASTGLLLSQYDLPSKYYEANVDVLANQHSAFIIGYNEDGKADYFCLWNYENKPLNQNVNAFLVAENQLTAKIELIKADIYSISHVEVLSEEEIVERFGADTDEDSFIHVTYYMTLMELKETLSQYDDFAMMVDNFGGKTVVGLVRSISEPIMRYHVMNGEEMENQFLFDLYYMGNSVSNIYIYMGLNQ